MRRFSTSALLVTLLCLVGSRGIGEDTDRTQERREDRGRLVSAVQRFIYFFKKEVYFGI